MAKDRKAASVLGQKSAGKQPAAGVIDLTMTDDEAAAPPARPAAPTQAKIIDISDDDDEPFVPRKTSPQTPLPRKLAFPDSSPKPQLSTPVALEPSVIDDDVFDNMYALDEDPVPQRS